MTRENLIKAIHDNTEEWSCNQPCSTDNCMKCCEELLAEYEQKLKDEAVEEVLKAITVFCEFDEEQEREFRNDVLEYLKCGKAL